MPTVAVIGDGQLARMMHTEAIELGLRTRVLAGDADASASQVFGDVRLGDYTRLSDLEGIARGADALTFDHEHVPNENLQALIDAGVRVEPRPAALLYAQDKLEQRTKLGEIGAPVPDFAAIASEEDARAFWSRVDGEVCLKATRGGYDGHGVWFPGSEDGFADLVAELLGNGTPLYAERKIAFTRELSAMVARNRSGEVRAWPVVESIQEGGVCRVAISPAPDLSGGLAERCRDLAVRIAEELDVTGVLAVELFEHTGTDGQPTVTVNELAMRPHNTGHWTQEGCVTSQFEQHLRAVLDLPLGDTSPTAPWTVMANVLGSSLPALTDALPDVLGAFPDARVNLYGKDVRPGRKLAHVNVSGQDLGEVRRRALGAAALLRGEPLPENRTDETKA